MNRLMKTMFLCFVVCFLVQTPRIQAQQSDSTSALLSKSAQAISYIVGGKATIVNLKGTEVMPRAIGLAKVKANKGITNIEVDCSGMEEPTKFGAEFLTYVLWAVSPEGSTTNIGEILVNKSGKGGLEATTQLQTFSLLVSIEPYFAVRQPSELVVLENEFRTDTMGTLFEVKEYKLMKRNQYQKIANPLALSLDLKKVPLDVYEARNAVQIARTNNAEKYAAEVFAKANSSLKITEDALSQKADKREIFSAARQTVQFAEDARALAFRLQEEERIAAERETIAARARAEAEAREAETKRKADEAIRLQAELAAAREAQMKAEAEAAAAKAKAEADTAAAQAKAQADAAAAKVKADADAAAAQAKAEAEAAAAKAKAEADAAAAAAKAEADALKAKEEAAKAEAEKARLAAEALRAQLLQQFNQVLETRDTPRGLVVNMADVLFNSGKYDLMPPAREKLAKLSGIVLAHPGLNLGVEGHTDSVGSDEFNQKLSEQRAETVRNYLVEQGLPAANLTAKGFGKTSPVADNSTAEGRQKNRRVEIIVSGEVIGAKIGR